MKGLLYYLIQVITCSGVLYGYYHFFLRNKKFHIYNRFYLLIAAAISILIPFLNIPIYVSASETNSSFVLKTITSISSSDFAEPVSPHVPIKNRSISTGGVLLCCYILIAVVLITRIALSLKRIRQIKKKYTVQKLNTIYFVNTNEPGTPFSFFRWLFWNQKIEVRSAKGEQVFRHELFHIEQKHSVDILYMETLATIFWINPFLHLIKKEIKVIHEFLADRFAMNEGGKWEYAELLLMQSLNTDHHLANPFFYNQIKRRIAMITSSQKTSYQYLRKIMVLPVAAIVAALFAFSYKNKKETISPAVIDKPVTVVIDAGHGVDPAGTYAGAVALDGTHEDDIVLSIAKKIKELNTNDRLQIILTREDKNIVDLKKRVEFATSQSADLFVSLHINTASKQEKNNKGIDILYSGKNAPYYAENKILATILYNYFYQIRPVNDIQTPKDNVYVIDNSPCPSALVECGYLTDPSDLAFVKDETGQAQIAKSILQSIEQYFLQKGMPDWEERKNVVSDTALPVVQFSRNSVTGKMEGSYNGKKFNKMTEYEGQFAFLFDDESSTMIMISKEQTDELKKKYGKPLNELMIKDPGNWWNRDSTKKEQQEAEELKEMLEQKQIESEKAEVELRQLVQEKQLETEKKELELKQLVAKKQLEMEKAELELKETLEGSQKKSLLKQQEDQKQLEEYLEKVQKDQEYLQKTKKDYLAKLEKDQEYLEKSKKEYMILQQKDQDYLQKSKKEYLLKQQKEQAQLEKSKKEFLIKQQEEQKQIEKSTKEYLLKQQKEQAQQLEAQKKLEKQLVENKQKADTQNFPTISRTALKNSTVTSLLKLPPETKVIAFTFTMDNDKGEIDVVDNNGNTFTPRTISLMQNAIAGRWITIDKIRIAENGTEKKLPALIYQVTN